MACPFLGTGFVIFLYRKGDLIMENLKELIENSKSVVFDIETTGLRNNVVTGEFDYIIEVGAIKIEREKITEKFASFVSCPEKLAECIINLTGITNEDLKDAPAVDKVLKDFCEFCKGCILVAHNLPFDYRFISYYGEKYGIYFNNQKLDTVVLAKEILHGKVENYKLSTLANYFNIKFTHHRALNDAETTAKILLELAKLYD